MPWTINEVEKFKKGLNDNQKKKWVNIANSVLEKCIKDGGDDLECEVKAIRTANAKIDEIDENELSNYVKSSNIIFEKLTKIQPMNCAIDFESDINDYQLAFPIGLWNTSKYGEVIITKTFAKKSVENWKRLMQSGRNIWMDTQHDFGAANAWAKDVTYDDDGIKVKWDFNKKGKELIQDKQYKYYSAAIMMDTDIRSGEPIYPVLEAVSLTNSPVMYTMPEVHLDKTEKYNCECIKCGYKMQSEEHCNKIKCPECGGTMRRAERPGPGQESSKNTQGDVKNKSNGGTKMTIEEILNAIKEGEFDSSKITDEQRTEIIEKFGIEIKNEDPEKDKKLSKENENLKNEAETLKDVNKQLSDRLSKIEKANHDKAKKDLFDSAIPTKIKPVDREKWEKRYDKNPESITDIINDMPKMYDFEEVGTAGNKPAKMEGNDKEYADAFGLTEDDYKNYSDSSKPVEKKESKEEPKKE